MSKANVKPNVMAWCTLKGHIYLDKVGLPK